jgi:hypothetical protein
MQFINQSGSGPSLTSNTTFYYAANCVRRQSMFGSVVMGVFQIIFCVKIHANDVFLFFKNYF